MGDKNQGRLISAVLLLIMTVSAFAQSTDKQEEDIVRLMNAKSLELIEEFGRKYRKTIDATFLHNGTYFICDTAIWDEQKNVINAWSNVQLIQDKTVLTSDRMDYYTEENVAQFRGALVQLQDKDNNTLRTRYLDYFTKDSMAVFHSGASMRSKDGQIIESQSGEYDSKAGIFTFANNVNMFTDSIFVRTEEMKYDSRLNRALFTTYIDFWKDDKMLSADGGWYDRQEELFFFKDRVHATSTSQEIWCDTLYFHRVTNDVEMFGNVQIQDPSRDVAALANRMEYSDSIATITMQNQAAVALMTDNAQTGVKDTVFIGADRVQYHTVKVCDIPDNEFNEATARLKAIKQDAVSEYRAKVAAEAVAAAKKAKEEYEQQQGIQPSAGNVSGDIASSGPKALPLTPPEDSLAVTPADSLSMQKDSLTLRQADTSKLGFVLAVGDVKVHRSDLQVSCDSLKYSDIDSLARLYISPVVWNETNRQYSSDSIFVLIQNNAMERADLLSNAFIITFEAENCYDQIKANEVMAYFDTTSSLRRFDALGGAQAMFYLEENDAMATVNKVESRLLTATFSEGNLDRVFYFENPKNDAFPVAQLKQSERTLKGFKWQPERRPATRYAVTNLEMKPSERAAYSGRPRTKFLYTNEFFPGYIAGIYREIEVRDSLARIPQPVASTSDSESEGEKPSADTSATIKELPPVKPGIAASDSSALATSTASAVPDTSSVSAVADSSVVSVPADSSSVADTVVVLTARQKAAAERQARREARWRELDERDAAKAAAREEQRKEKELLRLAREIARQKRQEEREQKRLEKFIRYYEKRKTHDGALKPSGDEVSPFENLKLEQTD